MKIKQQVIISAGIRILMSIIGLITYKLIAMTLGASGIVVLGQIKSITAIIMQVGIVGSNNLVVKLFARGFNNNSIIYSTIVRVAIFLNLFIVTIGVIFYEEIGFFITGNYENSSSIIYFIISIPAISLLSIGTAIVNGKANQIKYGFYVLSYPILFLLISYLFNIETIENMIVCFSISLIISSILLLFYHKDLIVPKLRKLKPKVVRKITVYGVTLMLPFTVNLVLLIYMRHMMTIINSDMAGYWQAVFLVNDNIVSIIYVFIITVLLPKALKLKTSIEAYKYLKSKYVGILSFYVLSSLFFYFLSSFILTLLYDKSFIIGEQFIEYQLVGDFFKILNWMFLLIIISFGLLKISAMIEIFNLFYSMILIEYCLNTYGIIGASYAYMFRYVGYLLITGLLFYIFILRKDKTDEKLSIN